MEADIRNEVLTKLQDWYKQLKKYKIVDSVYVFGSLIYDDGMQFDQNLSDIDLVVKFQDYCVSASDRINACVGLLREIELLERDMLCLLKRSNADNPIISIVAATQFEIKYGFHKDGKRDFYLCNDFLKLSFNPTKAKPLTVERDDKIHNIFENAIPTLYAAQKYRNQFLRISANGKRSVKDWDEIGQALPKEICRTAAQLRYLIDKPSDNSLTDVNEGLAYVSHLLYGNAKNDENQKVLHKWLIARQGGRGPKVSLNPQANLLLLEVLFDVAINFIKSELIKSGTHRITKEDAHCQTSTASPSNQPAIDADNAPLIRISVPLESKYLLYPFTQQQLSSFVSNYWGNNTFIESQQILNNIAKILRQLNAMTILVENDYRDADFLTSVQAYYYRSVRNVPKFCQRLHFFSRDLTIVQLQELIQNAATDRTVDNLARALGPTYLGFLVLRPLINSPIGTTALLFPPTPEISVISTDISVYLCGARLKVRTAPFQQIDRSIASCASTALWICKQLLSNIGASVLNEAMLLTGKHISHPSIRAATQGMTINEIVQGLRDLGQDAEIFQASKDINWFYFVLSTYFRCRRPIILAYEEANNMTTVMVLVGSSSPSVSTHSKVQLGGVIARMPEVQILRAHDFHRGPYCNVGLRVSSDTSRLEVIFNEDDAQTKGGYIHSAVVAFPHLLRGTPNELLMCASVITNFLSEILFDQVEEQPSVEAYFTSQHEYMASIYNYDIEPFQVVNLLTKVVLPEYVGVLSFYIQNEPVIEFVLDATRTDLALSTMDSLLVVLALSPGLQDKIAPVAEYFGAVGV